MAAAEKREPQAWETFAAFVLLAPCALLSAETCRLLWLWFAVPAGGRPLDRAGAWGLALLVSYFAGTRAEKDDHSALFTVLASIGRSLVALSLGAFVRWLGGVS